VCAEAADGVEAIQKAIETKPDLIINDLAMPVMDGLSASAEIAKRLPSVPILLFTLHKSASVEVEAKAAGVREVISKSDSEALVTAVQRLLDEYPRPAAPQ
jgi:CheY-like chemotaxis protein